MIDVKNYLDNYTALIFSDDAPAKISQLGDKLKALKNSGRGRVLIFGNGASASISSHFALDMTKQGKFTSLCFHDPALLTAFSNDFGYENAMAEIFQSYKNENDLVFVVSTSGESENIVRLLRSARRDGHFCVSFTGREERNRARSSADVSFWVDSHAYNIVENTHSIWLTALVDYLVGSAVYEVS